MPRPISKKWLARVEALCEQINDTINDARTVDQAGHLYARLESLAVAADERVCELDRGDDPWYA